MRGKASEIEKCARTVSGPRTKYHRNSVLTAETITKVLSRKQDSIAIPLDQQRKPQILENRRRIIQIIETIINCGQQGISLRGHRDSGQFRFESEDDINDGNFRALPRHRGKCDELFKKDYASAGRNFQFISPRIQNEIISVRNDLILKRLVEMVNRSRFFSVLADETTAISSQE